MTRYKITYYWPDGVSGDECDWPHPADSSLYGSVDVARDVILGIIGDHGMSIDENGCECWNESDINGCGGFCIEEVII
jgi:hypothetical protein